MAELALAFQIPFLVAGHCSKTSPLVSPQMSVGHQVAVSAASPCQSSPSSPFPPNTSRLVQEGRQRILQGHLAP